MQNKMKQAIMLEPGVIEYRMVTVPQVGEEEIKIKIHRIGVCGSDVHVNHGEHPYTSYPVVQGHEVSAEVVELGSNVKNFSLGDKVVIQPQIVCGECYQCLNGRYNICDHLRVMGFQADGMASEYFVVEASKALKLPDSMSHDLGTLVEPLAVAVHAVKRVETVVDKNVLVLGGGPIGNLVAQTAKAMGAKNVLVSEISEHRLNIAKECGLETVNTDEINLSDKVLDLFGKDKADVIFECVGINKTVDQAINVARKGTPIILVGVFGDLGTVNMGYIQDRELELIGSAMYMVDDFIKAIDLINLDKINLEALISNHIDFEEYIKAYELIDKEKDKVMKVIIDFK